jgi:hypothetical protein
LPIACFSIGCQLALSLSFSFLHDFVPMGPEGLLIYTQRILWRSEYTVGMVGVGAVVGAEVVGTTLGVTDGGFWGAAFGTACSAIPGCRPVLPVWTTLVCSIIWVPIVGGIAKLTF